MNEILGAWEIRHGRVVCMLMEDVPFAVEVSHDYLPPHFPETRWADAEPCPESTLRRIFGPTPDLLSGPWDHLFAEMRASKDELASLKEVDTGTEPH